MIRVTETERQLIDRVSEWVDRGCVGNSSGRGLTRLDRHREWWLCTWTAGGSRWGGWGDCCHLCQPPHLQCGGNNHANGNQYEGCEHPAMHYLLTLRCVLISWTNVDLCCGVINDRCGITI